jgi:hypothetical protein
MSTNPAAVTAGRPAYGRFPGSCGTLRKRKNPGKFFAGTAGTAGTRPGPPTPHSPPPAPRAAAAPAAAAAQLVEDGAANGTAWLRPLYLAPRPPAPPDGPAPAAAAASAAAAAGRVDLCGLPDVFVPSGLVTREMRGEERAAAQVRRRAAAPRAAAARRESARYRRRAEPAGSGQDGPG